MTELPRVTSGSRANPVPDVVVIEPGQENKQPVQVEEAIQKPEKAPSSVSTSANTEINPASDELNWSELAYQLELNAVARQLVLNSVVISWQQNHLKLGFLPELEVMLNQDLEGQIKRAIEAKLGLSLNLVFKSQAALDAETPQQAFERKQEQARQQVILEIRQDPVVRQLNSLFGAELIEQSVKKNHS